MKPIQERTQWHEYTTVERCQETGKPVKVYSLDVERALIWDSMTEEERRKLRRYDELVKTWTINTTKEDRKEFNELSIWIEQNDIDLSIIPPQLMR